MNVELLFKEFSGKGAVKLAGLFLSLAPEEQEAFVSLPVKKQVKLLAVPNKQYNKFLRKGYGEGASGVRAYCEFKAGQKQKARTEKMEKFRDDIKKYEKAQRMKEAAEFYMQSTSPLIAAVVGKVGPMELIWAKLIYNVY